MEVKHLNEGEWLTVETEKAGPVKLKIQYVSYHEAVLFRKLKGDEAGIEKIEDMIVDWNLTSGGKKVKCDKENKIKYIPYLIGLDLKAEDGKPAKNLGQEIMQFALTVSNFTKN